MTNTLANISGEYTNTITKRSFDPTFFVKINDVCLNWHQIGQKKFRMSPGPNNVKILLQITEVI